MTNDQLAQILQDKGLIQPEAAAKLKREALLGNRAVEDLIYESRLLPDDTVAGAKSEILRIPFQKIDFSAYDDKLIELIPEETARTYRVIPMARDGSVLVVGMLNPDDTKAQDALRFIANRLRLSLGVYIVTYGDWQKVMRKYSPYRSNVEAAVSALNVRAGEGRRVAHLEENAGVSDEAPIIKIVSDTLREAVEEGASDVHFEPEQNYLRIRFRVEGTLKETATLPIEIALPVVARIKVLSNLKLDESRIPQDGRFRARVLERDIDFRVATFPTPLGEKVAIRILDPLTGLKSIDQLGLVGRNLDVVREGLAKPYGMILITGPTGSGKTTTLYSLLQTLNTDQVNIVSLEDPVEYFIEGVNQSQVRPEIGYDFASGLRQILRQDPDIIMVGEIRDNETASLAIQAALTGHVVLSTLHTNNAAGVIPRLLDMKVEPFLIPVSLNIMIAQRLVGRLCDACKTTEEAPEFVREEVIRPALAELPPDVAHKYQEPYHVYRAVGCPACKGRGITGRIGVFEVLRMTPELEEAVVTGSSPQKIVQVAKAQHMISLRADGVTKALDGLIALEEVVRSTASEQ